MLRADTRSMESTERTPFATRLAFITAVYLAANALVATVGTVALIAVY